MTPLAAVLPALLSAGDAARLLGISERSFNERLLDGKIPKSVCHPLTYGQTKHRKYSRVQLERFAAGELTSPP